MACFLAPCCCFCAYAVLLLQRKLAGPAYESVSTLEVGGAASRMDSTHDMIGKAAMNHAPRDTAALASAAIASQDDNDKRVELTARGEVSPHTEAIPSIPYDKHRDGAGGRSEPLRAAPPDKNDGDAKGELPDKAEGSVKLLTGPPRSGFGKAADSVLQAALDEQRERTNEVLRKAMAEKERIFEAMREQSRRDLESGI